MNRRAQPWLGTMVEVTADCGHDGISMAFAEVALVHRLMSFHDAASDVTRFNLAAAGDCLPLHAHTWQVLRLAEQIQAASDGMFNIGCAPRLVRWGSLPAPGKHGPDYRPGQAVFRCEDDGTVRKLGEGWIDVGGIAKGYAVDLAVAALRQAGASGGCVNAGGDLRVFGSDAWPVSVRDPAAPQRQHTRLMLRDEALATSASYFSRRTHDGASVSALVDGRNGSPLVSANSVSVRAPRCAVADALTKVVLAGGDPRHPALAPWQAAAFII